MRRLQRARHAEGRARRVAHVLERDALRNLDELELLSAHGEESPVEAAETKRLAVEQEKARQAAEDSFLDGLALPGGGGGNKAPGFPSKKKNKKGNGKKKK